MIVADCYRRNRREYPGMTALTAWRLAKHQLATAELESRIEWEPRGVYGNSHGEIYSGVIDNGPIMLRIYADDERYEWGDYEPTEQEQRDLEVIGVGVAIAGEDDLETVWGVGYFTGDCWNEACSFALESGYIETAERELAERERLAGFVKTVA